MRVAVIGAGLLGLSTAWFLRKRGADVIVFDRELDVGLETSYANGGMLHASQASPWNDPGVILKALKMLGDEDAALLIRPSALLKMLPWACSFFLNSSKKKYRANLEKNTVLADYSLSVLNEHFGFLDHVYDRSDLGTLKIYRTDGELANAKQVTDVCTELNIIHQTLSPDEVASLEPALQPICDNLSGGIYFPNDVSGNAYLFCKQLAIAADSAGVLFKLGTNVSEIRTVSGQVDAVVSDLQTFPVDACVVAAGSYSPFLTKDLGLKLPVEPVKGYSLTIPCSGWEARPKIPVIDEHYHAAVCPLGTTLRVAGTAEFAGFDAQVRERRIANLFSLVHQIYPKYSKSIEEENVKPWSGFRPMSPDGVGIMGRTRVSGLYLNTGHGHLGWTMAPGAGKLVADEITKNPENFSLDGYRLDRF
jgi:D-amino-acid dehydrogenase